jgi:hypothetical protein
LAIPVPWKVALWICLGLSLYGYRKPPSVRSLSVDKEGNFTAEFARGMGEQPVSITPRYVGEHLALLDVKREDRRLTTPLALDAHNVEPVLFRRLRSRLRLRAPSA